MGIAQGGTAIADGANLAIQGVKPAGIAVGGQAIWHAATVAPWQLLAQGQVFYSATYFAMNTAGANLIVLAVLKQTSNPITLTDSQSNTWTLAADLAGGIPQVQIYYCIHPTVSQNHNFTIGSLYSSLIGIALKSPSSSIVIGGSTTAANSGTSLQLPAISVPANSILVTAVSCHSNNNLVNSIGGGFNLLTIITGTSLALNGGVAYLSQDSAASISPTWNVTVGGSYPGAVGAIVAFGPS